MILEGVIEDLTHIIDSSSRRASLRPLAEALLAAPDVRGSLLNLRRLPRKRGLNPYLTRWR